MPKFFVGQRVKVVDTFLIEFAQFINTESRISESEEFDDGETGYGTEHCPITLDGDGYISCWVEDQLEPILPEGHKVSDFSYEELLDHLEEMTHEQVS